ncbi:hypothetical protein E2562_009164 [Oryza meyeriana var. granulata]|uniref:Uncharacterized protein n=1 Tax=Oryza meyeriana var. granulata TaxID=110450 RepID=A0A6G1CFX2_9ORYZ|nr:hypothetical protein E2562_009164 [Oryza meyeriana var. granulata]
MPSTTPAIATTRHGRSASRSTDAAAELLDKHHVTTSFVFRGHDAWHCTPHHTSSASFPLPLPPTELVLWE